MTGFPIFVINLDDSSERLDQVTAQLSAQKADFTRISGYDGRKINPADVPEYDSAATRAYIGRDMHGGEIGCCISHIRAIKTFVETGAPYGLILEDDAQPTPHALELTQALIDWQTARGEPDWYAANLGAQRTKIMTAVDTVKSASDTATLYRGHYFPMLATAVLWTRAGAQAFLDICLPLDAPYDNFLRRWLTRNDMGLATRPPLFLQTGAKSEIDRSHTAKRRGTKGRTGNYSWLKAKRLWGDKFLALRHKVRRGIQVGGR